MKRFLPYIIGLLILCGIIAVLMHNKSVSNERAKNDVQISPAVTISAATSQLLGDTLALVGTTVANSDVNVVSEAAGRIVAVHFNTGDHVAAGAVLYQIDDELKRAALQTAEANGEKAKKDLQRLEFLRQEKTAGEAQYEGAKLLVDQTGAALITAKRQLSDTKITTPIAGVVTARMFDQGAYVQSGTVVANVVDIAKLKVRLNVAESDAFRIHGGDKVDVTSNVYSGESFTGTVTSISAKGDEAHTYPIEITLPNSGRSQLKAGMFVQIRFASVTQHQALTIPRAALVGSVKAPQVFVVDNGTAKLRDIVITSISDTRLAISKGLNEGESVIISGQNNIRDNSTVTVVQ